MMQRELEGSRLISLCLHRGSCLNQHVDYDGYDSLDI